MSSHSMQPAPGRFQSQAVNFNRCCKLTSALRSQVHVPDTHSHTRSRRVPMPQAGAPQSAVPPSVPRSHPPVCMHKGTVHSFDGPGNLSDRGSMQPHRWHAELHTGPAQDARRTPRRRHGEGHSCVAVLTGTRNAPTVNHMGRPLQAVHSGSAPSQDRQPADCRLHIALAPLQLQVYSACHPRMTCSSNGAPIMAIVQSHQVGCNRS